jgi:RNA polymerase sigma-70 factor (ECF subfamily)
LTKRALFIAGTNIRAWLFTLLHNQHVNIVRKSVREDVTIDVEDIPETQATGATQQVGLELEDVSRALSIISGEQRQIISLIGMQEMGYDEAAERLNIPVGTVRSRLSRGREKLRLIMNGHNDDSTRGSGKQLPLREKTFKPVPHVILPEPKQIVVLLPPRLVMARQVGRPTDPQLPSHYATAASTLLEKGQEINLTNLARELGRSRKAVEAYVRRHGLVESLRVVMRPLHDIEDYRRAIEGLVAKGLRPTHRNIGSELGLHKKGTVTRFLNGHRPELKAEYSQVLTFRKLQKI